jgi:thiazole biosynthesis enzyme
MTGFSESQISRAIENAYHEKFSSRISSDVVIVGAGPAGLTAAMRLAKRGVKVTVLEKRLSPGGGIWGGAMALNDVVVQQEALPILREIGVRHDREFEGLRVVDAVELASALCLSAVQAGAVVLNLMTFEDLCVHDGRVCGVVVNRSMISGVLHVDPITLSAEAVIDATGHEAVVVETLRKRRLLKAVPDTGEAPMDAVSGEAFTVDRVAEVFPGLWIAGMSVCATFAGPRMGPIFGGMLLSGARAAELIAASLRERG